MSRFIYLFTGAFLGICVMALLVMNLGMKVVSRRGVNARLLLKVAPYEEQGMFRQGCEI